jgi:hypothetical protein
MCQTLPHNPCGLGSPRPKPLDGRLETVGNAATVACRDGLEHRSHRKQPPTNQYGRAEKEGRVHRACPHDSRGGSSGHA